MDEELVKLIGKAHGEAEDRVMTVLDPAGNVEVHTAGGKVPYKIKPLKELYGGGVNALSIQPDSKEYMPLFMGIEQKIVDYWKLEPELTDGTVSLALDRLAMNPEAESGAEGILPFLQLAIRLQLSVHDYSRKDVQRSLRIISKSVSRHSRDGGRQGYLTFIQSFLG